MLFGCPEPTSGLNWPKLLEAEYRHGKEMLEKIWVDREGGRSAGEEGGFMLVFRHTNIPGDFCQFSGSKSL